jgi:hypothetical protein
MRIRRLALPGVVAVAAAVLAVTGLSGSAAAAVSAADSAPTWSGVGSVTLTSNTGTAPLIYSGDTLTFTVTIVAVGGSTAESTCFVEDTDRTVDLVGVSPALSAPSQVVVPSGQCTASFIATVNPVTIRTFAGFGAVTSDDPDPKADVIGTDTAVYPAPGSPGADTLQLTKGSVSAHNVNITVASTTPTANLTVTLRYGGHNPTSYPMFSDGKGDYSFQGNPDATALPVLVVSDHGGYLILNG